MIWLDKVTYLNDLYIAIQPGLPWQSDSILHHCPQLFLCPHHKAESSFAEFLGISSSRQPDSVKESISLLASTVNDPVKENT